MDLMLRKIVIGIVVLGALVGVYLGYLRLDPSARPDLEVVTDLPTPVDDQTVATPSGKTGTIAGVGVRNVIQTDFKHTDENGRVDRRLGFEQLLQSDDDQWVMTNPFLDLFLGDITVRVTADRGDVQIKMAFGEFQADDAMFEGNVVIRIIAADPNDPMTVFIYLDDVAFIAEQSLFSTIGAVRFVSRAAQLDGHGMELLYDASAQRLQLFRINDLDRLRLRSDAFGSLDDVTRSDEPAEGGDAAESVGPPAAEVATPTRPETGPPVDPNAAPQGDVYECIFRRNVVITTPEQVVTARRRLVIDNILWSGSQSDAAAPPVEPDRPEPGGPEPNTPEPNEPADLPYPGPDALDTTVSEAVALEAIPESFFDVVVTCDGGFVVAPKGSPELAADLDDLAIGSPTEPEAARPAPVADPNRQTVVAQRIEFDATTTNATLFGPVTMTFALEASDLTGRDAPGQRIPVTVTAGDAVRYLRGADRIQLEGHCAVTARQTDPNYTYDYMLTAPVLTLDLMEDPNAAPDATGMTLKRFATAGGPVGFYAQRKAAGELVGWVKLEACVLDYEAIHQHFSVIGPGLLTVHNGENLDVEADPNAFSLGRPCYARLSDFDVLTYSAANRLIVAETQAEAIRLNYIPQVNGAYDANGVEAVAGRIEIQLAETPEKRLELALLTASEGVTFVDSENEFNGAVLFYDHAQSLVTVEGDEFLPCKLNGALVDRLEMNPKTGEILTEIQTPTTLQLAP